MTTRFLFRAHPMRTLTLLTAGLTLPSLAGTYTWTGGGANSNWSNAGNWGGSAPAFAAGDTADLSALNLPAATASNVDAPTTLGTLLLGDTDNTHGYTLNGSTLTLDNNGAGAGIVQSAGSLVNTIRAPLHVVGDLTIGNASISQMNLYGGIGGSGAVAFTGTGGGVFRVEGGIGSDITAVYLNGNGNVTFATPFTIDGDGLTLGIGAGGTAQLRTEQGFVGTGDLTLAQLSGSGDLYIGGVNHFGSVLHVGTGTAGDQINGNVGANVVSIIQQSATSQLDVRGGTFTLHTSGVSTLVNDGGKALNLKQSTAGTGTLVLRNNTATGSAVSTDEGTLAHTGGVVSDGAGTGSTLIKSHIGTSITNITQNSGTSPLNLYDKTFNVSPGGTALVNNGGARIDFKDDVQGSGDLVLRNNSSVNDAIYFKEKVMNHAGRVVNAGSGTGRTRFTSNSKLGANVTALVQDSASSLFLVEGSLLVSPFAGDLTVKQGTLQLNQGGYVAATATVAVDSGAVLNLNFTGTKPVAALFLAGQPKGKGIYDSSNSGGLIAGNGALEVLTSPTIATVILLR